MCKLPRNTSVPASDTEKWIREGVLFKQEPNLLFKGYTERYCFLSDKKFIYNEHNTKVGNRAGTLNFDLLACSIEV